jgi:hypothetical protein
LWTHKKVKQFCDLKVLILRSSLEAAKNKVKQFLTFSCALMREKTSFCDNKVKQFPKPLPALGLRYLQKEI